MNVKHLRRAGLVSAGTLSLVLTSGAPALADDGGGLLGGATESVNEVTGNTTATLDGATGGATKDVTDSVRKVVEDATGGSGGSGGGGGGPVQSTVDSATETVGGLLAPDDGGDSGGNSASGGQENNSGASGAQQQQNRGQPASQPGGGSRPPVAPLSLPSLEPASFPALQPMQLPSGSGGLGGASVDSLLNRLQPMPPLPQNEEYRPPQVAEPPRIADTERGGSPARPVAAAESPYGSDSSMPVLAIIAASLAAGAVAAGQGFVARASRLTAGSGRHAKL